VQRCKQSCKAYLARRQLGGGQTRDVLVRQMAPAVGLRCLQHTPEWKFRKQAKRVPTQAGCI